MIGSSIRVASQANPSLASGEKILGPWLSSSGK